MAQMMFFLFAPKCKAFAPSGVWIRSPEDLHGMVGTSKSKGCWLTCNGKIHCVANFLQLFTLESWENLHFFNFTAKAKNVCGSRQLMLFPVYLYGETWGIPVRMNGSCSLPEGTCTGFPAGVYSDVANPGKALKSMGFLISNWSFQR